MRRSLLLPALALSLASCAHETFLITNPSGASVWVDERFVCVSPCLYRTPASELRDHTPVRLEKAGFETQRTDLQTRIAPSRIVGGIFTLGIVPLFKWPRTYPSSHIFNLRPLDRSERLAALERSRQTGEITDTEYQRLRAEQLSRP